MGIALTVIVIIALLVIARSVLTAYESEARKDPDSSGAGNLYEPVPFPPGGAGSTLTSGSHAVDRSNNVCGDSHHVGCDPGIHGGSDSSHGGHH